MYPGPHDMKFGNATKFDRALPGLSELQVSRTERIEKKNFALVILKEGG